jgi:hypothetical protein
MTIASETPTWTSAPAVTHQVEAQLDQRIEEEERDGGGDEDGVRGDEASFVPPESTNALTPTASAELAKTMPP